MLTLGLFIDGGGKDNYLLLPENYKLNDNIQLQAQDTKNFQINPSITNDKIWCRPAIPCEIKRAYGAGLMRGCSNGKTQGRKDAGIGGRGSRGSRGSRGGRGGEYYIYPKP